MTTITYQRQNHNPLPYVMFAVILAAVAVAVALPAVVERAHADKHAETAQIRQCWEQKNLLERWVKVNLKAGWQRDYCLIELPDKSVGCRIIQYCKALGWLEITAFIVGDGAITTAEQYLTDNNCQMVYP